MTEQQKAPQEQGVFKSFSVAISFEQSPELDQAIESLKQLAEVSRERVKLFLGGLDSFVQLVRLDVDSGAAGRAGEIRVLAQPSDRLLDFLATAGAVKG